MTLCAAALLVFSIGNTRADQGTPNLTADIRAKIDTPPPTALDNKNQSQYLLVSQNEARVPPLLGKTPGEATEILRQRGFTGSITAHASSAVELCPEKYNRFVRGLVCSTSPAPRETAPLNGEIILLVQGERSIDEPFGVPPNVVGMTLQDALRALHDHRFSVGTGQNPMQVRFSTHANCKAKADVGAVCALVAQEGYWEPGADDWVPTAQMGSTPRVPSRDTSEFTFYLTSARQKVSSDEDEVTKLTMIQLINLTVEEALRKLDLAGFRSTVSRKQRQGCNGGTWQTGESTPTPQQILGSVICWQSAAEGAEVRTDRPIYYQIKISQ